MTNKPKHLLLHLLQVLFFAMLSVMPSYIYAATGTVTITNASPITVSPNSTLTVQGTYLLSSDTTPSGSSPSACYFPPGTNIYFNGSYPGNLRPFNTGGSAFSRHNIHAYWSYEIDGGQPQKLNKLVTYTGPWNTGTDIGRTIPFSKTINTSGMALGSTHTATFFFEDVSSGNCSIGVFRSVTVPLPTTRVAENTITFTIGYPNPPTISIALDKPSITACEVETGTITVTSNDPTPNGGTVTLTFPNDSTASTSFAGKTATLTFADFGLPNGYAGTHAPNDVLTFTADVTTAAGRSASAQATADVIAGGLNVTITPAKMTVYPWLNNSRESYFPGKYSTPVDIQVTCGNVPAVAAQVSTQVRMLAGTETYGGHDHGATDGANKPTGTVLVASGQTDATGVFATTYHASEFSGQDEIIVTASYRGTTATSPPVVITSEIPGLIPITLPAGGLHQFVGGTCKHYGGYTPWKPNKTAACGGATGNSNQYISPNIRGTFDKLLNEYSKLYPGVGLFINDASLQFGGMFDVSGGWHTGSNHSTHRIGVDVDFALKDASVGASAPPVSNPNAINRLRDLINDNEELKGSVSFQLHPTPTSANHIHIWFKR